MSGKQEERCRIGVNGRFVRDNASGISHSYIYICHSFMNSLKGGSQAIDVHMGE